MHHDHEEHEPRSYMAHRNLHDIYENVEELLHMIDEDETLEDWMEHKISTARNAISDVFSAIRYDKHYHDEEESSCNSIISFGEWMTKKNDKN
jgi:hypothetical protein